MYVSNRMCLLVLFLAIEKFTFLEAFSFEAFFRRIVVAVKSSNAEITCVGENVSDLSIQIRHNQSDAKFSYE